MNGVECWIVEPLAADVRAALERLSRAPGVRRIAVMPDVHLARDVCVGTVVGVDGFVYPQAVGGDIGCGIATVRLAPPGAWSLDAAAAARLLAAWQERVPVVRHARARDVPVPECERLELPGRTRRDLAVEFGTIGRGNHFVELQSDADGGLWLVAHSGSRALGPAIRDRHVRAANQGGAGRAGLVALPVDGAAGEYLAAHDAAIAFAGANRRAIADAAAGAAADVLGVVPDWSTWCEVVHNFVRREQHLGEWLWVHRKGACSARDGEPGIVPGSMGTATYHVVGRGCAAALQSSSHGAGRCLPRGQARRRISRRQLERDLDGVCFDRRLTGRIADEAPGAYKDIDKVMRAQRELVRIERRLVPLLVHKGA